LSLHCIAEALISLLETLAQSEEIENLVVTESAAGVRCASLAAGIRDGDRRGASLIRLNSAAAGGVVGRNLSSGRRGSLLLGGGGVDSPKNGRRRGSVDNRSPAVGRRGHDHRHHHLHHATNLVRRRSSARRRQSCHETVVFAAAAGDDIKDGVEEAAPMEATNTPDPQRSQSPQGGIFTQPLKI
jgi:hypothetical protein